MARKTAATKKKLDQAELKNLRAIQITIEASEENLQRIAAMLLFADHLTPKYQHNETPLPWEDPNDPRYQQPPKLELDYNAIRNDIMKHLELVVKQHDGEHARKIIQSFGGERLGLVPEEQLLGLLAALETAHE